MYKEYKSGKMSETQQMIALAFFGLLSEKPYADISVSEICDRAQVARKSFYNNFRTKNDIISLGIDAFFDGWDVLERLDSESVGDVYRSAFELVNDNRAVFELLYERGMFGLAEEKLVTYATGRWPNGKVEFPVPDKYKEYYTSAMISAFVSILKTWLKGGFKESVDEMVALTNVLIVSSVSASL